ncbi:MAG TPA: acetyl-CoA carboxylase biotin carboxyl carrier protein [Oculatellaceae cyanobacterium]
MDIDLKQISDLLSVVSGTDITELTIESGDQKITVKKGGPVVHHAPPPLMMMSDPAANAVPARAVTMPVMSFEPKQEAKSDKSEAAAAPAPVAPPAADLVSVTSPMVGTFYRSSSPTAKPFVDVGDKISVGQTVCIIEAMKLMNDMPSEVAGKIVKICVDNGSTVEYGQQLFLVDPKG